MLEYLRNFEGAQKNIFKPIVLQQFSAPNSTIGYNDKTISDDIITELYLEFSQRTREEESSEYLRTLTGKLCLLIFSVTDSDLWPAICASLDNTFRSAGKASIADSKGNRSKPWKGGLQSLLTERGLDMNQSYFTLRTGQPWLTHWRR
jgi:hypothetical protein